MVVVDVIGDGCNGLKKGNLMHHFSQTLTLIATRDHTSFCLSKHLAKCCGHRRFWTLEWRKVARPVLGKWQIFGVSICRA